MFLKLLLLSTILIFISLVGLGLKILFSKDGKFPETHISRNKEMRKRGITCAQNLDVGCHPTDNFPGCSTCKVQKG